MNQLVSEISSLLPKRDEPISVLLERRDKIVSVFSYCRSWMAEQDDLYLVGQALMNLACFAEEVETDSQTTISEWVNTDVLLKTWFEQIDCANCR